MKFPAKFPSLRKLAIVTGAVGVIWIALEGKLHWAVLMALLTTALTAGTLIQRYLGGLELSSNEWLAALLGIGALFGATAALLTLLFMVVKTGLHGHGPEFTPEQVQWVIRQIPLWSGAGALAGLGIGLISLRRQ